jgi:hypothetical protein
MMRSKLLTILVVLSACGSEDAATHDAALPIIPDSAPIAPVITSFKGTPATTPIQAGVPNNVTWTWTYQTEPTVPEPTCTIDNGVGPVMRGATTSVTLSGVTTFMLTCENSAGSGQRLLVLSVPPVAPAIASFTVSPTTFAYNTATPVTFTWTFTGNPSPVPTCTVDGMTPLTSGQPVSLTFQQGRTFRLKCTNTSGTSTTGSAVADVSVAVTECGTAAAQCDPNANCTDTLTGYVCSCKAGYTGNGDTCTAMASLPCPAGEVGDGTTCTRLHRMFTTSTTGTGNLLTGWGVSAASGLAAADAVCAARATAAALPGTYVAWMSDSQNDAYCRVHGLSGKKANNCGQASLPTSAGPWVRAGDFKPFASTIDKLLAPNHQVFYAADYNESGSIINSTSDRVWTATDDAGVWTNNDCNSWTSSSAGFTAGYGEVLGGGTSWTRSSTTDNSCSAFYHLRCMETGSGPALPPMHPQNVKRAFITSVSGNGNLSAWPDSFGATGNAAPDAICQARARFAGYPNASAFKAWWTYYSFYISSGRINTTSVAYARPDGVILANNRTDLLDLRIQAPWEQTELNTYVSGSADAGGAWTGTYPSSTIGQYYSSSSFYSCSNWTNGTNSYQAPVGRFDLLDYRQMHVQLASCDALNRFYCVED